MFLTMHLNKEHFEKIKSGTKTVEMRLCDGARRYLTTGDTIEFINRADENQTLDVEVVGVHIYSTFADLYANFDKHELGYGDDEVADPRDMEKYYPLKLQQENCVMGIEIKVKK